MTIPRRSDARTKPNRIGALRVAAAVPCGSRVARGQAEWLRAVETHPSVRELRADARGHVTALAWVLARTASWSTLTTRPTWPVLMDRTALSRRSVARRLAWLRSAGLLGVVESGTTPRYSPKSLAPGAENRAALYVLAVPVSSSTEETGTPSGSIPEGVDPDARASFDTDPLRGPDTPDASHWPRTHAARSRSDRLEIVRRLQLEAPDLRRLTDRALRHLLRPWLLAGWTVADLMWALDHRPDGTERTWTTGVRSPGGWLLARLNAWISTSGVVRSPLSVELRAADAAAGARAARLAKERTDVHTAHRADVDFGGRVERVASRDYSRLLEVVGRRNFPESRIVTFGAMLPALARIAVRTALCPDHCGSSTSGRSPSTRSTRRRRSALKPLIARPPRGRPGDQVSSG